MKTITQEELNRRIELHKKWINDKDGGERLVLIDHDLRGVDLSGADLHKADLRGVDLRGSDLRDADLSGANLSGANLIWVDLSGADLRGAYIHGASIDYTSINLACIHTGIKMDIEQIRQLLYTVYMQECEDPEYSKIRSKIAPYVKRWSGLDRHGLRKKLEEVK
jgi:hypothetical protein